MKKFLLGSILALSLAACGAESGTLYEKSPDAIAKSIEQAVLPTFGDRGLVDSTITKPDENTIVITGNDEFGGDVFQITVKLHAEDGGTRVKTVFKQLHEQKGHDPEMAQRFAEEHVASAIEGRPFDLMFASSPAAKAVAAASPEAGKRLKAAGSAMSAISKMEQESHRARKQKEFDEQYGSDWGASSEDGDAGWGDDTP